MPKRIRWGLLATGAIARAFAAGIVDSPVTSFTHEADICGAAIRSGQLEASAMLWEDTLGNMRTLEAWRATC